MKVFPVKMVDFWQWFTILTFWQGLISVVTSNGRLFPWRCTPVIVLTLMTCVQQESTSKNTSPKSVLFLVSPSLIWLHEKRHPPKISWRSLKPWNLCHLAISCFSLGKRWSVNYTTREVRTPKPLLRPWVRTVSWVYNPGFRWNKASSSSGGQKF